MPEEVAPKLPDSTLSVLVESIKLFLPEQDHSKIQILCLIDQQTNTLVGAVGFEDGVPLAVEVARTKPMVDATISMAGGAKIFDPTILSLIVQYEGQDLVIVFKSHLYISILLHR